MSTQNESHVEEEMRQLLDAFTAIDLETVIEKIPNKNYQSMAQVLAEAANDYRIENDVHSAKVLELIGTVCSMPLLLKNRNAPFSPTIGFGRQHITTLDDFTEVEILFLNEIIQLIGNPMLRARVADLVWVRDKSFGIANALTAIENYKQIQPGAENWFNDGEMCWQRAIDLCHMIGPSAETYLTQIVALLFEAFKAAMAKDGHFALRLAQILKPYKTSESDAVDIAEKLKSLADEFHKTRKFLVSESYYSASANWFQDFGDVSNYIAMITAQAESFVSEAKARLESDSPSHAIAASFIEDAIQAYFSISPQQRDVHNVNLRLHELRTLLQEYGKRALDEMITIEYPAIDVGDHIASARNAVSGKPVRQALLIFANLHHTRAEDLRKAAIESLSKFPVRSSIPKVVRTFEGRVSGRTPGISGTEPDEDDEVEIRAEMYRHHYMLLISIATQALMIPALNVINCEHRVSEADFIELARQSPIVPLSREVLFGKALAMGFNSDFAAALHLLVPLFEHLVRYHLKLANVVTTRLNEEKVESECSLSTLVGFPEVEDIFGIDFVFELKALLCDPLGLNLRNDLAHGLVDDGQAHSVFAAYVWWLSLRVVVNPFWNRLNRDEDGDGTATQDGDSSAED